MSQVSQITIDNVAFGTFRSNLNDTLSALNTTQSGTSRPSSAVAGTIWLDTTTAASPTLKYYDGADDISLATLDHSANTVNWLDSAVSVAGLTTTATGTVLTLQDTNIEVSGGSTQGGEIRFKEDSDTGSNYTALKAGNPASNVTFTLPIADGTSGQAITTDGSGALSFSSVSVDETLITGQTAITSLADTDKFLVSDASDSGNLKYVEKQYLPSGTFNLIKTENVTSSTSAVNVTEVFSTTYDTYLVLIYRYLPTADGGEVRIRFLTGTNTEVSGANYDYSARYFDQDGSATSNTGNNQTFFRIADSIDSPSANGGFNASLWFNVDKNNSSGCSGTFNGTAHFADASAINHSVYTSGIYQDSTSSVSPTGIKFEAGALANIASVKISVYGVTK